MLKPNTKAPDFELADQDGNLVGLRDLTSSGPAVIFFYPADFTPVCTAQACMTRDIFSELTEDGVSVAGISTDTVEKHRQFSDRYSLPYKLLSDPDKKVIEAYEALGPFGLGTRRISYRIGRDGTIEASLRADLLVGRHRRFLLGTG